MSAAAAPAPSAPDADARGALAAAAARAGWRLRPLHARLGVEVAGVDLSGPLAKETAALIFDLICEYDLLLFRDQQLTPADEERVLTSALPHDAEALAQRRFCNGFFKTRIPDHPLVVVRGHGTTLKDHFGLTVDEPLSARPPYIDPSKVFQYTRIWHQDMGDLATLPEYGSIYMLQTPRAGGDTLFASTRLSRLADLDGSALALLRRLQTANARAALPQGFTMDNSGVRRVDDFEAKVAAAKADGTFAEQPLVPAVARDPDTGAEHLVCSAHCLYAFEGLRHAKSRALLEAVLSKVVADEAVYTHEWRPNDFVIWSNRRTIHTGTSEAAYADDVRLMHLVFLDSARPVEAADPELSAELCRSESLARNASAVIRGAAAAATARAATAAGAAGAGAGEPGAGEEWGAAEADALERVSSFV